MYIQIIEDSFQYKLWIQNHREYVRNTNVEFVFTRLLCIQNHREYVRNTNVEFCFHTFCYVYKIIENMYVMQM